MIRTKAALSIWPLIWALLAGSIYLFLVQAKVQAQVTLFDGYVIGSADVVSVHVWQQEELSRTMTVRPDGKITYPLLGDMHVVGMTPLELRNTLARELVDYVNVMDSEITVSVDEINSYTVSVLGEVNNPGRFSFQSQVTILDVLAEAGGFTAFATPRSIVLLRPEASEVRRIPFDYRDVTRRRGNSTPLMVLPGDIVIVP